jgi:hypothetical protein
MTHPRASAHPAPSPCTMSTGCESTPASSGCARSCRSAGRCGCAAVRSTWGRRRTHHRSTKHVSQEEAEARCERADGGREGWAGLQRARLRGSRRDHPGELRRPILGVCHRLSSACCALAGDHSRADQEEPQLPAAQRLAAAQEDAQAVHPAEGPPALQLHRPDHRPSRQHAEAHGEGDQHENRHPGCAPTPEQAACPRVAPPRRGVPKQAPQR